MFTQEVLNGFDMSCRVATAEIPATHAGHRAFVGVYPPDPEHGLHHWRVRRFELPEALIEEYFGEEALADSQFLQMDTLEQVENLLRDWKLADVVFEAPWKTDWPL